MKQSIVSYVKSHGSKRKDTIPDKDFVLELESVEAAGLYYQDTPHLNSDLSRDPFKGQMTPLGPGPL